MSENKEQMIENKDLEQVSGGAAKLMPLAKFKVGDHVWISGGIYRNCMGRITNMRCEEMKGSSKSPEWEYYMDPDEKGIIYQPGGWRWERDLSYNKP